jgi:glycosyltransferase involved in cell wall biosynthesis
MTESKCIFLIFDHLRVLALPRYSRLGASSRLRFAQYAPSMSEAGISIVVKPLVGDAYIRHLQEGKRLLGLAALAYLHRVCNLCWRQSFDVIWLEKDALPWLPAGLELAVLGSKVPLVLDYDDAVFHQYDEHQHGWVRRMLGPKHPKLMRRATCVVAGNDYIANFARATEARWVEVLPTVVDLSRYHPRAPTGAEQSQPVNVGWIGQRATASSLQSLRGVFQTLQQQGVARFTAIGIDAAALGLPMSSVPWSEQTEAQDIARLDVGIMPLVDAPFERGKCGYKLIQYMACGLPVVASPVGVNRQIVEHGINGFLAESPEQWATALRLLCAAPALRARMGATGRRKVEQHYSLQVTAPKLVEILRIAAAH